ncbi:hypothetical protein QFC22_002030 [Naganishia vaughanmartiniae]|uniref:Uncharacterized protein n=1 Tax=Naganishia vaughanmartiniae TaxID=1424756 RepID=A0ACC2XG34_9TREE|nr:hypothetical protein QFC22_002030 [Naganishia vaughanmartiniae]
MSTVLAKVALDVSVWGAFIVGVFWTSNGILEGKTPPEIHEKVSHAYLPSWCKSVLVFGPSQLFNFSVIPVPHRMLFMQCVGLGWNTFLSFANNRSNAMLTRAVQDVERVEEALEHAVEKVEEKVLAVAHKAGDALGHHTDSTSASSPASTPITRTTTPPPPPPASSYIASSPLEPASSSTSAASTTLNENPIRTHVAPTLQRYDEILADELEYQDALYPTMEDVPGCMTLLYVRLILWIRSFACD